MRIVSAPMTTGHYGCWQWSDLAKRARIIVLVAVALIHVAMPLRAENDAVGASTIARDPFPRPASAIDVTPRFERFIVDGRIDGVAAERAIDGVQAALRGARVVIVPSYLVDLIRPAMSLGLVDYFADQRRWLGSRGIETVLAPMDTEASAASNGRGLAKFIAASDTPLCIVSHSKGGLDTLVALSVLDIEDLQRIRCWIALQAPFAGSPLADVTTHLWLARSAIYLFLYALGGSPRSLDDMRADVRRQTPIVADEAILRVVRYVPTLAVAAHLPRSAGFWPHSHFEPTGNLMVDEGIDSDGVVPVGSAILPHARYVVLDGFDHGDTIDVDCAPDCPVRDDASLLKILLAITLDQR